MDEYEWDNNGGFFQVTVTIERSVVDSSISSAKWACLPNRTLCTPDRESVEPGGPNRYHIVLPAHCDGPPGHAGPAGAGFLAPDEGAGALVGKTVGGRT
jgi:hypothetical protein